MLSHVLLCFQFFHVFAGALCFFSQEAWLTFPQLMLVTAHLQHMVNWGFFKPPFCAHGCQIILSAQVIVTNRCEYVVTDHVWYFLPEFTAPPSRKRAVPVTLVDFYCGVHLSQTFLEHS